MAFNAQRIDAAEARNHRYGTVVRLQGSTIVTEGDAGREQSHSLAPQARVTQRGRTCRPGDIAVGARVRITTSSFDPCVASEIECLRSPGSS